MRGNWKSTIEKSEHLSEYMYRERGVTGSFWTDAPHDVTYFLQIYKMIAIIVAFHCNIIYVEFYYFTYILM